MTEKADDLNASDVTESAFEVTRVDLLAPLRSASSNDRLASEVFDATATGITRRGTHW